MSRIWLLAFCLLIGGVALCAEQAARKPLMDGLALQDVNGRLVHDDVNDVWLFDLTSDVNEAGAKIPAGAEFTLLPCATLAGMIEDSNDRLLPLYRLSVVVTQYRGRNYLWPMYYLSWSRLKEPNEPPQQPGKTAEIGGEPNIPIPVPSNIAEELKKRQPLRAQPRVTPGSSMGPPVRMLVDVVGFIEQRNGRGVFIPDALGLNVSATEYVLLPNAALGQAERLQAAAPDRVRFSVAGQISEFRGKQYLLLQRATRTYSYGDFGG
jgi:hypothetical protein